MKSIYVTESLGMIAENTQFFKNFAYGNGGAVMCDFGYIFGTTRCNFTFNSARGNGGAFAASGDGTQIVNLQKGYVSDNTAGSGGVSVNGASGGGVYVDSVSSFQCNSRVESNVAVQAGGGLFLQSANTYLGDARVYNNTSGEDGGGVYSVNCTGEHYNSVITHNSAGGVGGGMYDNSGTFTLYTSTIRGNTASTNGGGMYLYTSNCTTAEVTVFSNVAGSEGGGVYMIWNAIAETVLTCMHSNSAPTGSTGSVTRGSFWNMTTLTSYTGTVSVSGGGMLVENATSFDPCGSEYSSTVTPFVYSTEAGPTGTQTTATTDMYVSSPSEQESGKWFGNVRKWFE